MIINKNAIENFKKLVLEANLDIVRKNLVIDTWGNVSVIDRENDLVFIKPSGVDYNTMKADDIVAIDFNKNVIDGVYNPSSDSDTHLELYKSFLDIGSVVHVHSVFATSWAQAQKPIPVLGTTQSDYFYGNIPCTRPLSKDETECDYEKATGSVIVETFISNNINPLEIPGVLVASHGPFTWGKTAKEAVQNAFILENIAKMAYFTLQINKETKAVDKYILDKHYLRKHGRNAYYGQK